MEMRIEQRKKFGFGDWKKMRRIGEKAVVVEEVVVDLCYCCCYRVFYLLLFNFKKKFGDKTIQRVMILD